MAPQTPARSHSRHLSGVSTPTTPETGYFLAEEGTPTRNSHLNASSLSSRPENVDQPETPRQPPYYSAHTMDKHSEAREFELQYDDGDDQEVDVDQDPDLPSESSTRSFGSYNGDSVLEVLDDEDGEMEIGDEESDEDVEQGGAGQPLVSRGKGRRRRRWTGEEKQERSLIELIPPLLLAHPLPLLPLLSLLPYNFLPAGVVFFIPILCILALLSSCAHIVIVYLAWYLKVPTFEDVFATVTGRFGRYGLWGGRFTVICATTGLLVGWLGTLHSLLEPVIISYLPRNAFFSSRTLWTIIPATALLPSLLPSRMTRSLRRSPVFIALLLPVVVFLIIGRTVEVKKALEEGQPPLGGEFEDMAIVARGLVKRKFGLAGGSSAGAGLTTLTIFLSPHLNTLPIHSTLSRNNRSSFPMPCLFTSAIILTLSLPLALVPYYLLPAISDTVETVGPTTLSSPSGVLAQLPADDAWLNLARALMCAVALGSCNMWILRGRDCVLKAMGVERGERQKAGKWVGLGIWIFVVFLACIGGWVAEKVELLGVMATLAVGWFLPSLFFIITFHVRSPLAIVFPSKNPPDDPDNLPGANPGELAAPSRQLRSHARTDSLNDPSTDVLLARKERQLQKKRLGRRLWQDLIVYVGILPVGCVTLLWTFGSLVGIW